MKQQQPIPFARQFIIRAGCRRLAVGVITSLVAFVWGLVQSNAAAITWQTPQTISGNTDVSTNGALVYAYTESGVSASCNGVTFAAGSSSTSLGGGNVTLSGFSGGVFNGFDPSGSFSTDYHNLITGGAYANGLTGTVTLNNLTSGRNYLVQFWVADYRVDGNGRTEVLDGQTTLSYKPGQYAIGTFTASGSSQLITLVANASMQINAIQVRDVTDVVVTRSLSYNANGATSGIVPVDGNSPYTNGVTVTVLGNSGGLSKPLCTFTNWNTAANGGGTAYNPGSTFVISQPTTLYAQWTGQTITLINPVSGTVAQSGSGSTNWSAQGGDMTNLFNSSGLSAALGTSANSAALPVLNNGNMDATGWRGTTFSTPAVDFSFNLGITTNIAGIVLGNYFESGQYARGVQSFDLQLSTDHGANWTTVGTIYPALADAGGQLQIIDFGTNYAFVTDVKFANASNTNGSFGFIGLNEVRFIAGGYVASPYIWNNGSATGNWNTSDANWTGRVWSNGSSNNASFVTVGGTINLSAIVASNVVFGTTAANIPDASFNGGSLQANSLTIQGKASNTNGTNPTLTLNVPTLSLAGNVAVGRANLAITGGAVNANRLVTASGSPDYGTLTLSGGSLRLTNGLDSSVNGTVSFSMNLSGGALYTPSIRVADWEQPGFGLNVSSYLDGAVIHPTASSTNFITLYGTGQNLYLGYNGSAATFSTDGYDITVGASLLASGTGGLTKQGAGTLTLSGRNTYSGPTMVQGGVLALANSAALGEGPLNVSSGAKAALNFTGQSYVTQLTLNGVAQATGTYGSTSSAAANKNDTYFTGTGMINVTATIDHIAMATNSMIAADAAWAANNWAGVRSALSNVINDLKLPAQWRSIPHLRFARSYQAAGDYTNASAVFGVIAATTEYPRVHQMEGADCKIECDRLALGLPGRDATASQVAVPTAPPAGRTYYVATNGSDSNPGTLAQPFATVNKALAANRAAGPVVAGEVLIQLASGRYVLTNTIALSSADSANGPLHLKAATPGGTLISGSKRLSGFTVVTNAAILARLPAEAQGRVMQCSLPAQGITDYGSIKGFGGGYHPPDPVVNLYANGVPQTLAQWPNSGFVAIAGIVNPGSGNYYTAGSTPQTFTYSGDRPSRWTNAPDGWLHGYFAGAAYDESVAIGSINPQAHTITTAWCVSYTTGWAAMNNGAPYRAFNLLEEIDQPGEWYLDRTNGILYWYPSVDPSNAAVDFSVLSVPMLTANNVSNLRIEGLVFEASRSAGLQLNNCTNALLTGCTIRNFGGVGVALIGGRQTSMIGCDVHGMDQVACRLDSGDRDNLVPGGSVIANCRIRDVGRVSRSGGVGIYLIGVSNRVTHCEFENMPNTAIWFQGVNHLTEYNEFRNCCNEADDSGVIASWGNPTYRGNIWRFNRFTHCGGGYTQGWVQCRYYGSSGFRFDDAISGQMVYGNVFDHLDEWGVVSGAMENNSGRDNVYDNNLVLDTVIPNNGYYSPGNDMYHWRNWYADPPNGLTSVYLAAFPELNTVYDGKGQNYVWRCASFRGVLNSLASYAESAWGGWQYLANTDSGSDPGFLDGSEIKMNPADSLFWSLGMRAIPVNEIGLYDQATRAGWIDDPASRYWNGTSGNWDNASVNWSTNSAAAASGAWKTNGYTTAVFAGAGGTVTVAAPITAEGLTFATSGYTLAGTNPVVLNNSVALIDQKGHGATINAPITGMGGIAVAGTGTLTLGGTNRYNGTTSVRVGTLALSGGDDRLPTNTIVNLGDGGSSNSGMVKLNGCNQQLGGLWTVGMYNFQYGLYSGNRIINGSATPCTLTLNIENGMDQFVGTFGGGGLYENNFNLVKNGGGKLWLGRGLNLAGSTTVAAGTLELHTEFYMGNQSSGTFNIASNATLAVTGHADAYTFNNVTINYQSAGGGTFAEIINSGQWLNWILTGGLNVSTAGGAQNTFSATPGSSLNLNGNNISFNVVRGTDVSSDLTVTAQLSGNGNITKQGNGILSLLGTNNYTGSTTVNGGTVILRNPTSSTGLSVAAGAVLELNITNDLDVPSLNFSGAGTVRKTGAGQWICGFNAANFALSAGSLLDIQSGTFVGGSTANEVWSANHSDLNVAAGAVFNTVEANVRVNRITGAGTLGTGFSGAGYQNLTFGVDNGSSVFDGVIQNTQNNPSYVGNVVKVGTGTIALNGANTYAGTTTVSNGTLLVNGIVAGSTATVSGGVLGGIGTISGPVTVQSGAALAPGASIGTLTISNTLTLASGSRTLVELNATTGTNDLVRGLTTANYGGTLVVSNLAGVVTNGQTFQLFSAAGFSGNFNTISNASAQPVTWSFNRTNGVLTALATVALNSTNLNAGLSGTNLVLTWPADHTGWTLLSQTNNLNTGVSANTNDWLRLPASANTNVFILPVNPTNGGGFFRLTYP